MDTAAQGLVVVAGVVLIVWGAETFAEHLSTAAVAYNVTMSLGAGALAGPLRLAEAGQLHAPWLAMIGVLVAVLVLATPGRRLTRPAGAVLLAAYPVVVAVLAR